MTGVLHIAGIALCGERERKMVDFTCKIEVARLLAVKMVLLLSVLFTRRKYVCVLTLLMLF